MKFMKQILLGSMAAAMLMVLPLRAQTTFTDMNMVVPGTRGTPYQFGYSVDIYGDYAIVGAPHESDIYEAGAAYVFQRNPSTGIWSQVQRLVSTLRNQEAHFGWSVSINNTYIVIGAPGYDLPSNPDAGTAYVFELVSGTWTQTAVLSASDAALSDNFGTSVAVHGSNAIVGAPYQDNGTAGSDEGAAYVFNRSGAGVWSQVTKATASDKAAGDHFGWSVSMYNNDCIIGAPDEDHIKIVLLGSLTNIGAAYYFAKSGSSWVENQKITAALTGNAYDHFGTSVSIYGSNILIGSPYNDYDASGSASATDAGAAYTYKKSGTTFGSMQKIVSSDRATLDKFGYSVDMGPLDLVVGAPTEDEDAMMGSTATDAGSCYIFNMMGGSSWAQTQKLAASTTTRSAGDQYGFAVAIYNTRLVVGAPLEDENTSGTSTLTSAGGAYFLEGCPYSTTGFSSGPIFLCDGQSTDLLASFTGSPSYQWQINTGSGWSDLSNGGIYSGATTNTLHISKVDVCTMDGYQYRVKVTAGCGSVIYSSPNTLVISVPDFNEQAKIVANDATTGDLFGDAVAISNDYAVVGAYNESNDAAGGSYLLMSGSAYIYERDALGNWNWVKKITAPVRAASDQFGYSVAIYGDYIVVGAPYEDEDATDVSGTLSNAGSIYIYKRTSGVWGFFQKLTALTIVGNDYRDVDDHFGWSVAIDKDLTILVGAPGDDEDLSGGSVTNAGGAYFFTYNTGTSTWNTTPQKVVAPSGDRQATDLFGSDVSIDHLYAVVSAPLDDQASPSIVDRGAAYMFEKSTTWNYTIKLTHSSPQANDAFGSAVSIDETTVVIGAPYEDAPSVPNAGSVYVFDRTSSWTFTQELTLSVVAQDDYFGRDVAISGNYIVVGCNHQDITSSAGEADIFQRCSAWTFLEKVNQSDVSLTNDDFGNAVDIAGGRIIIADWGDAVKGAAYLFESCMDPAYKNMEADIPADPHVQRVSEEQPSIVCYPNPAQWEIRVDIRHTDPTGSSLEILDMNGKLIRIYTNVSASNTIPVDELTPGVYLVRWVYSNGSFLTKFIKQ